MTQTNGEFFKEKLANLIAYCRVNLTSPTFQSFVALMENLEKYSIADALAHFATIVAPMGVQNYINQILQKANLVRENFEKLHLEKLQEYLDCFVSIVMFPL
jgi:hypothetical protein